MRPILALTALLSIIGGLKVFDLVFIMTRGGPTYSTEVLATMLYREAFELNDMGVASAIARDPGGARAGDRPAPDVRCCASAGGGAA